MGNWHCIPSSCATVHYREYFEAHVNQDIPEAHNYQPQVDVALAVNSGDNTLKVFVKVDDQNDSDTIVLPKYESEVDVALAVNSEDNSLKVFVKVGDNSDEEIIARIATDINGWTDSGGGWYADGSGFFTPLPDYCNSIHHAVDLAKASNISIQPLPNGWRAIAMDDVSIASNDPVLATAIAITALAIFDSKNVPTNS
jgi:hypothetical protein